MKTLDINDIDLNNPDACFHFTKIHNVDSINKNGLSSIIGGKSEIVDKIPKVCFGKSIEGPLGLVDGIARDFILCLRKDQSSETSFFNSFLKDLPDDKKREEYLAYYNEIKEKQYKPQKKYIEYLEKEILKNKKLSTEEYKDMIMKIQQEKDNLNRISYEFAYNLTEDWLKSGVYYYLDIKKCKNKEEYDSLSPQEQEDIYYFDETFDERGRPSKLYDFHAIPGKNIPKDKLSIIEIDGKQDALSVVMGIMSYYKDNIKDNLPEYYEVNGLLEGFYNYMKEKELVNEDIKRR